MKNVFVVMVFVLLAFTSSCKKEDLSVSISDSARIEQIQQEISANPSKYALSSEDVLTLYKKQAGGLKNWIIDPKVGFSTPKNDIILSINGDFKRVIVWTIVAGDFLFDKGIIVVNYDVNYNQIGDPDFFIGWENEYCVETKFSSNVKNMAQTSISFSYPIRGGRLSFNLNNWSEGLVKVYLAQLEYDCSWEISNGNAVFGGTISFNPADNSNMYFLAGNGLSSNTRDYIIFDTPANTIPNSKVVVIIWNELGYGEQTTINFPERNALPVNTKIPLTFIPIRVTYQAVNYQSGMAEYGDTIEKYCILTNPGEWVRIYTLK